MRPAFVCVCVCVCVRARVFYETEWVSDDEIRAKLLEKSELVGWLVGWLVAQLTRDCGATVCVVVSLPGSLVTVMSHRYTSIGG